MLVVLVVLLVLLVLVKRPKIRQWPKTSKNRLSPKSQILPRPKTAMDPPEKIILLLKLGLLSSDYERYLLKQQSFIILIRNVISGLKLMYKPMPLVESSAKWFRIDFFLITWLQRTHIQISLSLKLANGTQWPFSPERWFLKRLVTRLRIRSSWLLLKPSRLGATTWKAANTRSSSLLTITTFVDSWIQKAWP